MSKVKFINVFLTSLLIINSLTPILPNKIGNVISDVSPGRLQALYDCWPEELYPILNTIFGCQDRPPSIRSFFEVQELNENENSHYHAQMLEGSGFTEHAPEQEDKWEEGAGDADFLSFASCFSGRSQTWEHLLHSERLYSEMERHPALKNTVFAAIQQRNAFQVPPSWHTSEDKDKKLHVLNSLREKWTFIHEQIQEREVNEKEKHLKFRERVDPEELHPPLVAHILHGTPIPKALRDYFNLDNDPSVLKSMEAQIREYIPKYGDAILNDPDLREMIDKF